MCYLSTHMRKLSTYAEQALSKPFTYVSFNPHKHPVMEWSLRCTWNTVSDTGWTEHLSLPWYDTLSLGPPRQSGGQESSALPTECLWRDSWGHNSARRKSEACTLSWGVDGWELDQRRVLGSGSRSVPASVKMRNSARPCQLRQALYFIHVFFWLCQDWT